MNIHLSCFTHHAYANSVHFWHPCIFSPDHLFASECHCYSCYSFLLQGWFSAVRQHCWGKSCRLITLDSHKLNANGLWIHIKVPDGCEWWQKTNAWFAFHSVTFALFTFLINTERHIPDDREGWRTRRRKNQTAILWAIQWEKTSSYIGLTCHVNKCKWGHGRKKIHHRYYSGLFIFINSFIH